MRVLDDDWRDVTDEEFAEMLAGDGDCLVDLSQPGDVLIVTLQTIREFSPPEDGTLYGIPVIFEDE